MKTKETWKTVVGYEKYYEVSSLGKVRSNFNKGKTLVPNLCNKYYSVTLCGDKRKNMRVHRIVALAFIPNPENLPQINHINGNKLDNRYCNLEWTSPSNNIQHALKNNLFNPRKGESHNHSKLTIENVKEIRNSYKKVSQVSLSTKFNVSKTCINNIIKNKSWNHVN